MMLPQTAPSLAILTGSGETVRSVMQPAVTMQPREKMTASSTLRARASSRLRAWRSRSERPWDATSRLGLMFFCAALYIGLGIKYANFLTADNFFITLLSVTSIGVAAIGMTALLISGNVDLSIGGQYAFISMVTAIVARSRVPHEPFAQLF